MPLLARSLAPWQSCWCAKLPFCFKTSTTPRDRGLVGATSCHGKGASEGGWELCDATIRIIESASVCMWLVVGQGQLFANASRCFSYLKFLFFSLPSGLPECVQRWILQASQINSLGRLMFVGASAQNSGRIHRDKLGLAIQSAWGRNRPNPNVGAANQGWLHRLTLSGPPQSCCWCRMRFRLCTMIERMFSMQVGWMTLSLSENLTPLEIAGSPWSFRLETQLRLCTNWSRMILTHITARYILVYTLFHPSDMIKPSSSYTGCCLSTSYGIVTMIKDITTCAR